MKWLVAIVYHPIMLILIIVTLFTPFMLYDGIKQVIKYEVPSASFSFVVLSLLALWVYLAMKSEFLGRPYRKVTILLPLMQMAIYTSAALTAGGLVLNDWADHGAYSKSWAIGIAAALFIAIRLLMSLLYWKHPVNNHADHH
ncbi:hypothetical protein DNH61_01115 [Paenibacillus sambharensis]|uniref:Uncharacterized protein n=1 Tax=Paenibacillus sambharensis TaxID=1803190 RepID=A0A2W1LEK0_9BACL|nr:hypothetical protein [Paenibacillus sambharensis]PZD97506.1 hypothetical protein DNH61_01115 [Paenibacillus sambharensis]